MRKINDSSHGAFLKGAEYMNEIYFPDIVGNNDLLYRLSKDISENRLAHAYIIEGQRGSGRHTAATQVAAAIECEARASFNSPSFFGNERKIIPCGKCPSCLKILDGKSPDVKIIGLEEDKVTMGVDTIRNLKNDMYTAPNDLSVKVYIIEDADRMTVQAQNAFLLSLEEPPEYVLFFLLCENSSDLIETVRSRAPTLRTEHIPEDEIEKYLLSHDKRAESVKNFSLSDWKTLLSIASGSIGYAAELLDDKKRNEVFELRRSASDLIVALSRSSKKSAIETVSSFGTKRQDVIIRLNLIETALRDLIILKKCESAALCFYTDRDEAQEISDRFTAKSLFTLYDAVSLALNDLELNSNVRLTLMNMMRNAKLI